MTQFLQNYQLVLSVLGGVVLWMANEWSKRAWEDRQRREEHYRTLLSAVDGFYGGDIQGRSEFLDQLRICWLHCPDEIIRKANRFLSAVHENSTSTKEEKENAIRDLALAMRKDLFPWYRRTSLLGAEFQLVRVRK